MPPNARCCMDLAAPVTLNRPIFYVDSSGNPIAPPVGTTPVFVDEGEEPAALARTAKPLSHRHRAKSRLA